MTFKPVFYTPIIVVIIMLIGAVFYFVILGNLGNKKPKTAITVLPKSVDDISLPLPSDPVSTKEETPPKEEVPPPEPVDPQPDPKPVTPPPPPSEPKTPPPDPEPEPIPPPPEEPETPPVIDDSKPKLHTVSMIRNEFVPELITITVGDTIRWINDDTELHWPSADPHPTHSSLPQLDPLADISPGEFYFFTFTKAGTFVYHDHTQAIINDEATITGIVKVLPKE